MEHLEMISLLEYGWIWFYSSMFFYSYFCLPEAAETDFCCSCVYVCVRAMELPNTSI